MRVEPFYSLLGSLEIVRKSPIFPLFLLLFFPVGAFISLSPMIHKSEKGKRKFYLFNSLIAVLIMIFFTVVFVALGEELYRCDILKIPNCD